MTAPSPRWFLSRHPLTFRMCTWCTMPPNWNSHAAFPVPSDFDDVRHSVGVGLRSTVALQGDFGGATISASPWPVPASAQRVIKETKGTRMEKFFRNYWGFPGAEPGTPGWTPQAEEARTETAKL